ncbi:MAG: AraC family transcriptional regulator [Halochromatium sp.]|nr:AraC family transcriptional regulator [Halochromatium sp.]
MSQLTALYVYKVVSQASPGVDTADLVKQLGLDPEGPIDPARMVSSAAYYDVFAALVDRDPNGLALPLRIGAAMRSDEYGAFGLAWKSAPTVVSLPDPQTTAKIPSHSSTGEMKIGWYRAVEV